MKGLRIIVVVAGILVALIAFTRAFGSDEKTTFPLHAHKLVEAFASAPEMQTTIAATKKVEW